jgi:hypothetical protein
MEARIKASYRWNVTQAFSGREYVKNEFRPVPEWAEAAASADERFEVRQPAVKETIVAPVTVIPIEPEAYPFEEDPIDEPDEIVAEEIEEAITKPVVKKSTRKRKVKQYDPEA